MIKMSSGMTPVAVFFLIGIVVAAGIVALTLDSREIGPCIGAGCDITSPCIECPLGDVCGDGPCPTGYECQCNCTKNGDGVCDCVDCDGHNCTCDPSKLDP